VSMPRPRLAQSCYEFKSGAIPLKRDKSSGVGNLGAEGLNEYTRRGAVPACVQSRTTLLRPEDPFFRRGSFPLSGVDNAAVVVPLGPLAAPRSKINGTRSYPDRAGQSWGAAANGVGVLSITVLTLLRHRPTVCAGDQEKN
jgi:hypothetical protein